MAAAKFIQKGDSIDYTASGVDIAAGTVIVLAGGTAGKLVGVTERLIPANTKGAVSLRGVYEVDCLGSDVPLTGDKLYWDAGNQRATLTSASNTLIGPCVEPKTAANATRVRVRLDSTVV